MSQLVGTWVAGDASKVLLYTVMLDGAAFAIAPDNVNLRMLRRASGVDTTVVVSGGLGVTVTGDGILEFSDAVAGSIGAAVATPDSRATPDIYECRITFFQDGETYWTDPFEIAVVKFP